MNRNAVAHAVTISALTIKYGAVSATATRTDTISDMSQTLHRSVRSGRMTMQNDYISRQAAIDTVKYDYFTAYTKLEGGVRA